MIRVSLSRGNSYAGVGLQLPATPADIGQAFAKLDSISTTAQTVMRGFSPELPILAVNFSLADWDDPTQVGQLNSLAEKLEQMTAEERQAFYALISVRPQAKPDELLNLTESISDYQVMKLIQSPEDLGEYLVAKGFLEFPSNVKPYLHYGRIGGEQHQILKGSFTEFGYVVRKDAFIQSHDSAVISLYLTSNSATLCLPLPTNDAALEVARQQLNIQEFAEARIPKISFGIPYLDSYIPTECACVGIANELASCIQKMSQCDGELLKYLSVLSVEQPETMADALFYANELDNYERVSSDPEKYGKMVLRRMGASRDVMQALDGNADFATIGEHYMKADGVRRTEFGLVRRCGEPFPEEAPGMVMGGM